MLKDSVLSAVRRARDALSDLLVDVQIDMRVPDPHVPGTATTYVGDIRSCKIVIIDFEDREIDGGQVRATDQKGILFDEIDVQVDHKVIDGTMAFRVMRAKPYRVGSAHAATELHLRPLGTS